MTQQERAGATAKVRPVLCLALALAGCEKLPPPPPHVAFVGLPVSGSLADAHRAGFTDCYADDTRLRCRRHAVTVRGQGPYEAALDLAGSDGRGGFDHVTLWHDRDQYAVYALADLFEHDGWHTCATGTDTRGDQQIYTHPGAPAFVSMDLSYWGKRRLRLLPAWNKDGQRCPSTAASEKR